MILSYLRTSKSSVPCSIRASQRKSFDDFWHLTSIFGTAYSGSATPCTPKFGLVISMKSTSCSATQVVMAFEWHLIEIESPTAKLLTKRGDPSKELTHALRQVREWQRWIERNHAYADELMPGIDHPLGHVFMRRRSELASPAAKEHLRAINIQNRAYVEVGTLDSFIDRPKRGDEPIT